SPCSTVTTSSGCTRPARASGCSTSFPGTARSPRCGSIHRYRRSASPTPPTPPAPTGTPIRRPWIARRRSSLAALPVIGLVRLPERRCPAAWAEDWDRVGLVLGEPESPVGRVLLAVDCDPSTVAEAVDVGADFMLTHHPLLLRGVSSVAATTYKGRVV